MIRITEAVIPAADALQDMFVSAVFIQSNPTHQIKGFLENCIKQKTCKHKSRLVSTGQISVKSGKRPPSDFGGVITLQFSVVHYLTCSIYFLAPHHFPSICLDCTSYDLCLMSL